MSENGLNKITTNENNLSQEFLHYLTSYDEAYAKQFIIHSNLDGQYHGILFEFKKEYNNKLKREALIECIKNASKLRLQAKDVPAKFALIFLKEKKAYIYDSMAFYAEIHQIYDTSASKSSPMELGERINEIEAIDYSGGYRNITKFLDDEKNTAFLKVEIDRNNVVKMAERFYNENGAKKSDFYNELIKPNVLKYIKQFAKNEKDLDRKCLESFPDLIDAINDVQLKKETGAFYTPKAYSQLSTGMVRKAIKFVPQGNDYIILDRCAGTGGLEEFLTDEELSHTICSTFEMWEWKILNERYKSETPNQFGQYTKLRLIIPPEVFIEKQRHSTIKQTIIAGDALSEHFITGKISQSDLFDFIEEDQRLELNKEYEESIKILNSYVASPNCNVIILENPPYRDISTGRDTDVAQINRTSFVKKQMGGTSSNDIANQFIWSAQKYYLKKPNDFLILYSPVKYFKSLNLCNKHFIDGYLLNRKHFKASESAISLIMWQNEAREREYPIKSC